MKSTLLTILTIVALATPTTTAPSNTRFASRDLRVTWDEFQPPSSSTYDFLEKTARDIGPRLLGTTPAQSWELLRVDNSGASAVVREMRIALPPDAKPQAAEFLDELIAGLQKWADEQFNRQREEHLRPFADARDEATKLLDRATQQAKKERAVIRELAGRADVTTRTITGALTNLEDENQKLELDLMAKRARAEALQMQIAEQSEKLQKQVESDPIVSELEKVVEARDKQVVFKKQQVEKGLASVEEMNGAVVAAAEARAKMLQRKRDAVAEAGGGALEGFNRESMVLSVDVRELEARLKFVDAHLKGLRDAMERLDSLQRAESDLAQARGEYD